MPRLNLRRYDVQATCAMVLSLASLLPVGAAAVRVLTRYDADMRAIPYGSGSVLMPVMFACLGAGLLLSFLGMVLGLSSAGQRRNDRPARSWIGFFLGAAVFTLAVIVTYAFWTLKVAVI